jgi:hypothetical protein
MTVIRERLGEPQHVVLYPVAPNPTSLWEGFLLPRVLQNYVGRGPQA